MFAAYYAIIVGLLMCGQWGFFLATGQVPELATRPVEIIFHLVAEGLTAFALITGGIAGLMRRRRSRPALLISLGMLVYTVIQSAGYFAQQHAWPPVAMFGILLVLTITAIGRLIRE